MSKSKSKSSKDVASVPAVLSKVKEAAITKPIQKVKAVTEGKKKKVREPTPSESESDSESESESEESASESESEVENKKQITNGKVNGVKAAPVDESSEESSEESDSASSESSEDETPIKKSVAKEESDSESEEDSDESSDEEVQKKTNGAKVNIKDASDESDASEEDSEDSDSSEESEEEVKPKPVQTKRKAEDEVVAAPKKAKVEEESQGSNLFVGNLSWNVDEAWLTEEFEKFGELSGVRLITDRDSGRSKGYGYVEFVNASDAATAHSSMKGAELDGRAINVDFANSRPTGNKDRVQSRAKSFGDSTSAPSDTLFCGNLAFDVGQDAVSQAFADYGNIMGVRLPTDRETGEPKGFGYITFGSVDEAKAALEAMQGADIGGRSVRLDYSQPRPQNGESPGRGRGGFGGGFGGRGRGRGGFDRGGRGGGRGRGGFNDRGGRGGRGGSTNRGGFGDFAGKKITF